MENYNLPWTPEGMSLLAKIEGIIEGHGGLEDYTQQVIEEMNVSLYERDKRRINMVFKQVARYNITYKDATEMLGINRSDFERRYYRFRNENPKLIIKAK